ncbi:MAG: molybdate ABC transporter substrate-binding protein [Lachnospiraceae bacterium]|nr:molybdate ABC transporter substrate-binding protein [Lachnospiraceae bacterium]
MKKMVGLLLVFVLSLGLLAGCGSTEDVEEVELIIGAAMSLKDVTEELARVYMEENPHVTLTFSYASSGALQTQIEEGAPMDIFMSAAAAQMNNLIEQDLIYGDSTVVAGNEVVLVVPEGNPANVQGFEDVATDQVSMVGLGDPETMPIGRFAQEVFVNLGIEDVVYAKANLGSDVRQVLTWVEMNEVEAGVVFKTDAMTTDQVEIVAVADADLHAPSLNPVGIVEASQNKEVAGSFIAFLMSPVAQQIFADFGFASPN